MKTSVFYSKNPETAAFGRVALGSQDEAIVHVAVRNASNYRHVMTCKDGSLQDLWELLQPTVSAITRRLGYLGLQIGAHASIGQPCARRLFRPGVLATERGHPDVHGVPRNEATMG